MKQREDDQRVAKKSVQRINIALLTLGVLSLLAALALTHGTALVTTTPLYLVFTLVCSTYLIIRSKWRCWPYALSIVAGIVLVWLVALVGFYKPNQLVLNEAGQPDKSINIAVGYILTAPESLTTAMFFDCNTAHGPGCTPTQNMLGVCIDYAILASGLAVGNLLIKRRITTD